MPSVDSKQSTTGLCSNATDLGVQAAAANTYGATVCCVHDVWFVMQAGRQSTQQYTALHNACAPPFPDSFMQLLVELGPAPAQVCASLGHQHRVYVNATHAAAAAVHRQCKCDQALVAAHIQHISTLKPTGVQHLTTAAVAAP
jgi:hypothetical protein